MCVASVSRHRLWIMRQRRSGVLLATVTAVAGESDMGVTVSAAFATGVGCWSGCWGACLPLGSLYAGCGQDFLLFRLQLLVKNTAPFAAVSCYLFPVLRVDVRGFHVTLADISVPQLGLTNAYLAGGDRGCPRWCHPLSAYTINKIDKYCYVPISSTQTEKY